MTRNRTARAGTGKTSTKKQVLKYRWLATSGGCCRGCCGAWANMMHCTCLEDAGGTTGCGICNDPNCNHPNEVEKH